MLMHPAWMYTRRHSDRARSVWLCARHRLVISFQLVHTHPSPSLHSHEYSLRGDACTGRQAWARRHTRPGMHAQACTYRHVHIHKCASTRTHARTRACMHARTGTHTQACTHRHIQVHKHTIVAGTHTCTGTYTAAPTQAHTHARTHRHAHTGALPVV